MSAALWWRRLASSASAAGARAAGAAGAAAAGAGGWRGCAAALGSSSSSGSGGLAAGLMQAATRPFSSSLLGSAGVRRPLAGLGGVRGPAGSPVVAQGPAAAGSGVLASLRGAWGQQSPLFGGWVGSLWARFSSTLKKRRSKMNKHKLKKRRKLMRNKNKRNL